MDNSFALSLLETKTLWYKKESQFALLCLFLIYYMAVDCHCKKAAEAKRGWKIFLKEGEVCQVGILPDVQDFGPFFQEYKINSQ